MTATNDYVTYYNISPLVLKENLIIPVFVAQFFQLTNQDSPVHSVNPITVHT